MKSFLFVCVGNICRSPALMGRLEHLLKEKGVKAYVESCGLHGSFLGSDPDRRMQEVAAKRGIALKNKAKLFEESFFDQFDVIFCVTKDVLSAILAMAHTQEHKNKVHMATHYSHKYKDQSIPDPFFQEGKGFEHVWEMVDDACQGIYNHFFC